MTRTRVETREQTQDESGDGNEGNRGDGNGNGSGNGDWSGDRNGNKNGERKKGERRALISRHIRKEAEKKTRYCHSERGNISVDRRCRLQLVISFRRKTRRLPDDVVPKGEPRPRNGREEMVTGAETGVGAGTRAGTGMGTKTGMGVETGAGTGTIVERRVGGREDLEIYEVVK